MILFVTSAVITFLLVLRFFYVARFSPIPRTKDLSASAAATCLVVTIINLVLLLLYWLIKCSVSVQAWSVFNI